MKLVTLLLMATAIFNGNLAHADAACEKKIAATKMIVLPDDAKIVCDTSPTPAAQDCMVELLAKGKGKLRNPDFFEIFGLCRANPGKRLRDCVLKKLPKSWDAPDYQGIHIIGDQCAFQLAGVKVKSYPTYNELMDEDKRLWDREHPNGEPARNREPRPASEPVPAQEKK